MEGSRDWAGLVIDILECISGRLIDPKDFVRFRAVCPQWRDSIPVADSRFVPWILKTEEIGRSGNIEFYSLGSGELHKKHVPALKAKRTRIAGSGAGLLIGVDLEDDLTAVLVNPLTGDSSVLPCLPEWCRDCTTYGFVTDPKVTGEEDVFVVIYSWWWPVGLERRDLVALWRLGDASGWATIPSQRFWPMMPQHRSRLAKHGPRMLEDELATAATNGGANVGKAVHDMESAYIEHKGQVHFLYRHEIYTAHLPQVTFELDGLLGDNTALVDWASVPYLHDKVILQSRDITQFYCLPASDDLARLGLSKNCIYFLSHLAVGGEDYYLFKWNLHERVATTVKKIPGLWEWVPGKWFLPTLRKCSRKA